MLRYHVAGGAQVERIEGLKHKVRTKSGQPQWLRFSADRRGRVSARKGPLDSGQVAWKNMDATKAQAQGHGTCRMLWNVRVARKILTGHVVAQPSKRQFQSRQGLRDTALLASLYDLL